MTGQRVREVDSIANRGNARTGIPAYRGRAAGFVLQFVALLWLSGSGFLGTAGAAELKQVTLDAFQRYVAVTEKRMAGEIDGGNGFLWVDQLPSNQRQAGLAQLHQGQVITQRLETQENGRTIEIPSGMVHHWVAL